MTIQRQDKSNTLPGPARRKCDGCGCESGPLSIWPDDTVSLAPGWKFRYRPFTKTSPKGPREVKGVVVQEDLCPECLSKEPVR